MVNRGYFDIRIISVIIIIIIMWRRLDWFHFQFHFQFPKDESSTKHNKHSDLDWSFGWFWTRWTCGCELVNELGIKPGCKNKMSAMETGPQASFCWYCAGTFSVDVTYRQHLGKCSNLQFTGAEKMVCSQGRTEARASHFFGLCSTYELRGGRGV